MNCAESDIWPETVPLYDILTVDAHDTVLHAMWAVRLPARPLYDGGVGAQSQVLDSFYYGSPRCLRYGEMAYLG